jgi:bifunctional N-acetylglucosamine-1-phosphate-uridyltransferase/glucosamine-1-phosphate-acetyltransferase GlmU-like protein
MANFDGVKVNHTTIGDNCYIGSGAILIAPLELKDGSHVSAGTVVSQESVEKIGLPLGTPNGGKEQTSVSK